ncbi:MULTISPECIES: hypothetical protein [unclassified Blastococcus]
MTTLLFLLLVVVALRTLAGPARRRRDARPASWPEAGRWLVEDVLAGARELGRLDAGRRERAGRPWS